MTIVKGLAVVALLVGGASLAMAQSGPPTGGQPPVAGGAAGNPAVPGPAGPAVQSTAPSPYLQSAAPPTRALSRTRIAHHQMTKHHKKMYMSTKGHKATVKENSRLQATPSSKQ